MRLFGYARWLRLAAEQGNEEAQLTLGAMYDTGDTSSESVPKIDTEAQLFLGRMYNSGQGVPKDDVRAYAWVNIGAAQIGDEKSGKVLEVIAEEMTASAVTKAQSLSREYWEAYGSNRALSE